MTRRVPLTQHAPHQYSAWVRGRNSLGPAIELRLTGLDRTKQIGLLAYPVWLVETDVERWFSSLDEARDYIDRFFEPAKEEGA